MKLLLAFEDYLKLVAAETPFLLSSIVAASLCFDCCFEPAALDTWICRFFY